MGSHFGECGTCMCKCCFTRDTPGFGQGWGPLASSACLPRLVDGEVPDMQMLSPATLPVHKLSESVAIQWSMMRNNTRTSEPCQQKVIQNCYVRHIISFRSDCIVFYITKIVVVSLNMIQGSSTVERQS